VGSPLLPWYAEDGIPLPVMILRGKRRSIDFMVDIKLFHDSVQVGVENTSLEVIFSGILHSLQLVDKKEMAIRSWSCNRLRKWYCSSRTNSSLRITAVAKSSTFPFKSNRTYLPPPRIPREWKCHLFSPRNSSMFLFISLVDALEYSVYGSS
jgi:hypothetical protein